MQNLAFIKNVLLFLFSVQNRLFGMKWKICLIKGEQSIIQAILITARGGRRWCLDMLVTCLLCVPHIPVVDRMPAVQITLPMKRGAAFHLEIRKVGLMLSRQFSKGFFFRSATLPVLPQR